MYSALAFPIVEMLLGISGHHLAGFCDDDQIETVASVHIVVQGGIRHAHFLAPLKIKARNLQTFAVFEIQAVDGYRLQIFSEVMGAVATMTGSAVCFFVLVRKDILYDVIVIR